MMDPLKTNHYQNSNDDFGDFQTCENLQLSDNIIRNNINKDDHDDDDDSNQNELNRLLLNRYMRKNIFELSSIEFQNFRQQFFDQKFLNRIFDNDNDDDDERTSLETMKTSSTTTLTLQSFEDIIINKCPVWLHLTENFRKQTPLNFQQSYTFKKYVQSLKLMKNDNNIDENDSFNNRIDSTVNQSQKRNIFDEEDDIANDLDMHSLIISSFIGSDHHHHNHNHHQQQQQPQQRQKLKNNSDNNTQIQNTKNRDESNNVIDADQVIKEIESFYSNNNQNDLNKQQPFQNNNDNNNNTGPRMDPLLSLDAATLLNVALKSWQKSSIHNLNNNINNNNRTSIDDYGINLETFEYVNDDSNEKHSHDHNDCDGDDDDDENVQEYHSLPANLNEKTIDQINVSKLLTTNSNSNSEKSQNIAEINTQNGNDDNNPNEFVNKLKQLTIVQLNELYMELEQIIQIRSEILIQELALRDELEYEKEQKNQFISLLLSVQNERRHHLVRKSSSKSSSIVHGHHHYHNNNNNHNSSSYVRKISSPNQSVRSSKNHNNNNNTNIRMNRSSSCIDQQQLIRNQNATKKQLSKNNNKNASRSSWLPNVVDLQSIGSSIKQTILPSQSLSSSSKMKPNPVYLTTVIPYTSSMIPIDSATLDILIKLLKALNEDSPTVPALLTDYILKVICP